MVSVLENTEQNLHGTASKVVTVLAPNWNSSFSCFRSFMGCSRNSLLLKHDVRVTKPDFKMEN